MRKFYQKYYNLTRDNVRTQKNRTKYIKKMRKKKNIIDCYYDDDMKAIITIEDLSNKY